MFPSRGQFPSITGRNRDVVRLYIALILCADASKETEKHVEIMEPRARKKAATAVAVETVAAILTGKVNFDSKSVSRN